jgi:hypothetical protein
MNQNDLSKYRWDGPKNWGDRAIAVKQQFTRNPSTEQELIQFAHQEAKRMGLTDDGYEYHIAKFHSKQIVQRTDSIMFIQPTCFAMILDLYQSEMCEGGRINFNDLQLPPTGIAMFPYPIIVDIDWGNHIESCPINGIGWTAAQEDPNSIEYHKEAWIAPIVSRERMIENWATAWEHEHAPVTEQESADLVKNARDNPGVLPELVIEDTIGCFNRQDSIRMGAENYRQQKLGDLLMAIGFFQQQKLLKTSPQLSRHEAKRVERADLDPSNITIVHLRKTEYLKQARTGVDSCGRYSHRWIVSGHWRQQPCGPGLSETKTIAIMPYVKGPSHLPIIYKDKILVCDK